MNRIKCRKKIFALVFIVISFLIYSYSQYDKDFNSSIECKNKMDNINRDLQWKELAYGLWKNRNGDIGFKVYDNRPEYNMHIDKYITEICCDGKRVKDVIDIETFKPIEHSNRRSIYYRDKEHIYKYYPTACGGNFYIEE